MTTKCQHTLENQNKPGMNGVNIYLRVMRHHKQFPVNQNERKT